MACKLGKFHLQESARPYGARDEARTRVSGLISKAALAEHTICASGSSCIVQTTFALDCDFSPIRDNEPWHSHNFSSARGISTQSSIAPMLSHAPNAGSKIHGNDGDRHSIVGKVELHCAAPCCLRRSMTNRSGSADSNSTCVPLGMLRRTVREGAGSSR